MHDHVFLDSGICGGSMKLAISRAEVWEGQGGRGVGGQGAGGAGG